MPETRDRAILEHILRYCGQIMQTHGEFEQSKERFCASHTYQNAVCMCILQIGELAGKLSDSFKTENSHIPWTQIRGMRNFVAHEYGHLDLDIVWFTATQSIPALMRFCERTLTDGKQP